MKFLLYIYLLSLICNQNNSKLSNTLKQNNPISKQNQIDTATFGSGCFWCTEAIFQRLKGVVKVTSGYSGGEQNNTYQEVSTGKTGHAEVSQILYNPEKISYIELLEVFWKIHDPTTLNRQGNDIGPQYRSIIFYHNDSQKQKAEELKIDLDKVHVFKNKIVTFIEPYNKFYPAENYHQNYFNNNSNQSYCRLVILPKVEKFKKVFKEKLKEEQ